MERGTRGLTESDCIKLVGVLGGALGTTTKHFDCREFLSLAGVGTTATPKKVMDIPTIEGQTISIQYYSCFISYSSPDEIFARRLHTDLQDHGVRCWFAPHDLRPGQLIRKGVDEAIHLQDKLLLILSEHSVESGWVSYEVETALTREIQQKREILFPIRIDDTISQSTTDWARKLWDQRHIGDFRQWTDPEHYQKVFQRLLRDLKQHA
jgi:hypothetical protein